MSPDQGALETAPTPVPTAAPEPENREESSDEAALLNELALNIVAPQFLIAAFREMAADRAYVYRDAMLLKTQDTVAVNHVLRNQRVSLAYLGVADPQPFVQPARRVGRQVAFDVELFSQTMEIHLAQQFGFMDFARKIEGGAQDASTNRYAVLKVCLQSDYMKDPIGRDRFGDMQEQVAQYVALQEKKKLGLLVADGSDAQRIRDLEETLRLFAAGKIEEQIKMVPVMVPGEVPAIDPMTGSPIIDPYTLQPVMTPGMVPDPTDPRDMRRKAILDGEEIDILGMPELESFLGYACDQILPEDFRWDWSITRPEDWANCDWMGHRVYMHPNDICAKFQVSKEELYAANANARSGGKMHGFGSSNSTAIDPSLRLDIEGDTLNDRIAVWEIWHKKHFRRYVFIVGMRKFLVNEVPQAVGKRFYPFFPLYFNRVSGQVMAISDVGLARPLQDECNMLRSHDREYRRAAYPVIFIPKGLLDKDGLQLYRDRLPFSVIEVARTDEVKKYFAESSVIPYDPKLTDTSKAEIALQQMFGIPAIVTGASGTEDLASAVALSKEGMETGVAQRRIAVNRVITDILQYMAEISLKVFGEKTIKLTCGDMAIWPRLSSEELFTNIRIEIRGGLTGQPRSKDRLDLWMNFATIAQSLNLPVNGIEVLRELLDAMGLRIDPARFMIPLPVPGMAPMGMPGMPTPGGPMPPAPSRGAGPDGGAPLMTDPQRGAPSNLSQIPNHPPLPQEGPPSSLGG